MGVQGSFEGMGEPGQTAEGAGSNEGRGPGLGKHRFSMLSRGKLGAHYTPPDLVDLTLVQALPALLEQRVVCAEDPVGALLDLNVIDPAMGTGAFVSRTVIVLGEFLRLLRLGVPADVALDQVFPSRGEGSDERRVLVPQEDRMPYLEMYGAVDLLAERFLPEGLFDHYRGLKRRGKLKGDNPGVEGDRYIWALSALIDSVELGTQWKGTEYLGVKAVPREMLGFHGGYRATGLAVAAGACQAIVDGVLVAPAGQVGLDVWRILVSIPLPGFTHLNTDGRLLDVLVDGC